MRRTGAEPGHRAAERIQRVPVETSPQTQADTGLEDVTLPDVLGSAPDCCLVLGRGRNQLEVATGVRARPSGRSAQPAGQLAEPPVQGAGAIRGPQRLEEPPARCPIVAQDVVVVAKPPCRELGGSARCRRYWQDLARQAEAEVADPAAAEGRTGRPCRWFLVRSRATRHPGTGPVPRQPG